MTNSNPTRSADGATGLDGKHVVSQESYDLETTRIFSNHWICVARVEELNPTSGCLPIEFENNRLFLTKSDDGSVRAFRNFCRHRGSRLVTEENCGSIGKRIQCPYHAWTYDRTGALCSAPNMDCVNGFNESEHGLIEVACSVQGGFVWINLSPAQSLTEWLSPIAQNLVDWRLGELRIGHEIGYSVEANWKLIFQNYNECYHCPIVHPLLNQLTPYRGSTNDLEEGPILGGPMGLGDESQTMSMDGRSVAPVISGLSPEQARCIYYFTILPTMFLSLHPDFVLVHRLERQGNHRTNVICQFLFEPEAINTPGFDPKRAVEFWDLTNRQDWEVCELAQAGMTDPGYIPGPYSNLESVIAAFDRHYLELMAS